MNSNDEDVELKMVGIIFLILLSAVLFTGCSQRQPTTIESQLLVAQSLAFRGCQHCGGMISEQAIAAGECLLDDDDFTYHLGCSGVEE